MALLFYDSFDHYVTADILKKWNTSSGASYVTIVSGGRNSSNAIQMYNGGYYVTKTIANSATVLVGCAVYPVTLSTQPFISLLDGSNSHADLRLDGSQRITITRNGTLLETSTFTFTSSRWYFIEFRVTIDNSGSWEVRCNGTTILSGTGDTRNDSGNAYANMVKLANLSGGASSQTLFDDVYIRDDSTFMGDCRVDALLPNGDGTYSTWVASSGSDYQCVDEANPNDDTDYISSATAAEASNFTFPDITGTATIKATQVCMYARKDNAGSRNIMEICRSGGSDYDGTSQAIGDSYLFYREIRETNPKTASAWDIASVNAAEFGVELVS